MERKRQADQRSSTIVEPKRRKTEPLTTLVLKAQKVVPGDSVRDSDLSPLELFLCQFEDKENDSSTLAKLIRLENLLADASHCDPKFLGGFVQTVQKLMSQYRHNEDVLGLLVRMCKHVVKQAPGAFQGMKEVLFAFLKPDSPEVKTQALSALLVTAQAWPKDSQLTQECLKHASLYSLHYHHAVRAMSLYLQGTLATHTKGSSALLSDLSNGCNDGDARVRTAALKALTHCLRSGVKLDKEAYQKATKACNDDFERTRSVSMQLVRAMAMQHPEWSVPVGDAPGMELRLIDDAFVKICDMVNDCSVSVRTEAARFLGDFHNVSVKFLQQTLDKKLMSDLRRVKTNHERQRDKFEGSSSAWDSGKQLLTAVPQLDLSAEEVSLMNQGACGAFIHALEDEHKEVRLAALESMSKLAERNKKFGILCVDFLIDMFNDEIEDVRLLTILCIRKIASHLELREDQLDIVLGSLKDASAAIRESLHGLLGNSRIPSTAGFQATITALLTNLSKYSSDKMSIWSCLKDLGVTHGGIASALVPSLLSTHPFLMTSEPNIDDPAYISILILVFNACVGCPTIPALFPSHIHRHYCYLRDMLPDLVPQLALPSVEVCGATVVLPSKLGSPFLEEMVAKAQHAFTQLKGEESRKSLEACIRDVTHVAAMDTKVKASAHFTALFWQCQLHISQVLHHLSTQGIPLISSTQGRSYETTSRFLRNLKKETVNSTGCFSHKGLCQLFTYDKGKAVYKALAAEASCATDCFLLHYHSNAAALTHRMEHTFCGVNCVVHGQLLMLRLCAEAAAVLLSAKALSKDKLQTMLASCVPIIKGQLENLQEFFLSNGLSLPTSLAGLAVSELGETETSLEGLHSAVVEGFHTIHLKGEDVKNLRETVVELIEPTSKGQGAPLKFLATLALSLNIQARAKNAKNVSQLVVQVGIPDGHRLLFLPKPSDWRHTGVNEDTLQTCVFISHGAWTAPCNVEVSVALVHTQAASKSPSSKSPSVYQHIQQLIPDFGKEADVGAVGHDLVSLTGKDSLDLGTVSFCEPISVCIHPLPENTKV